MRHILLPLLAAALALASSARAAITTFYVGLDTRPSVIGGTYNGLPNPNVGRLTMLFAHPDTVTPSNNHYHGIGIYRYSGPAGSPTIENYGTNFQIPESYTALPPLALSPTSGGLYDGRLTLHADPAVHYSETLMNATRMLSGFAPGTGEAFLYNSSAGRYTGDMADSITALQLISLTPGLHVGSATQLNILQNPYDTHLMGIGNNLNFAPVYWTDAAAPEGNYSARFRVLDLTNNAQPSGEFVFNLRVVPEPGSAVLALGSIAGLLLRRRRA